MSYLVICNAELLTFIHVVWFKSKFVAKTCSCKYFKFILDFTDPQTMNELFQHLKEEETILGLLVILF